MVRAKVTGKERLDGQILPKKKRDGSTVTVEKRGVKRRKRR